MKPPRRCRTWLIRAERIGTQSVAGVGEGTGARSAADVAVLAGTAFSVELVGRVQRAKDLGDAVEVDQRPGADVAAMQRQESRRIDFAQVRDEDDAVSVTDRESVINGGALVNSGVALGVIETSRPSPLA